MRNPDEPIAAIPHLLRFEPQECIVFLPMSSDLPVARVDLPTTSGTASSYGDPSRDGLSRCAQPGSSLAIICLTADHKEANVVAAGAVKLVRSRALPRSVSQPLRTSLLVEVGEHRRDRRWSSFVGQAELGEDRSGVFLDRGLREAECRRDRRVRPALRPLL